MGIGSVMFRYKITDDQMNATTCVLRCFYAKSLELSTFSNPWGNLSMRRCKFLLMSDEKTGKNEAKGNSLTHWINDNNDDSNKSDSYTVLDHVCALYTLYVLYILILKWNLSHGRCSSLGVLPTILVSKYVKNSRSRSNWSIFPHNARSRNPHNTVRISRGIRDMISTGNARSPLVHTHYNVIEAHNSVNLILCSTEPQR